MTQGQNVDIFRIVWQNLALVDFDSAKFWVLHVFRFFRHSLQQWNPQKIDLYKQQAIHLGWLLKSNQKSKGNLFLKKTQKKACDFYEQGILLRWFSTPNKEPPSCRKMLAESYVAPTRRSEIFFPKKILSWKINKVWQEPHEHMVWKCWKISSKWKITFWIDFNWSLLSLQTFDSKSSFINWM